MYRPQIKVLDCTIRDGGLINNHYFSDEFVREAYRALSKSGSAFSCSPRLAYIWARLFSDFATI